MKQTTTPKQIWTIIFAAIALIMMTSAVTADVTLDGTIWDQDGNPLGDVNVSVYNASGLLNVSANTTLPTGEYSMTVVTSTSGVYNITFTKPGYDSSIVVSKVMIDGNSYTVNRTLVQTNNDFDGDGVIDIYDCFSNDATRGTLGGVYDNRYDTNCNGVYQGDEVPAPSSGGSSSSSSSSRRTSGRGVVFSVREYNLTSLESIRTLVTYADVLRIQYQGEQYDMTLARIRNDSVRFKIGRPIDSYFILTPEDPIRGIFLNEEYDTPGMYITYYGNATDDTRQIEFEISSEPFNQTDEIDTITDNVTENSTIPVPPINITPNATDNGTQNATTNQSVFGRVGSTVRSFAQGETTLGQTAEQLFAIPLIKIPILFMVGGLLGLGVVVGTRRLGQSWNTKKKAKNQEVTEEDITPDTITRITEVLQKQLDVKNAKRFDIQKQKY